MEEHFVKIINATYKILEGFSEQDPLKTRAKEKALAVMENLTVLFTDRGPTFVPSVPLKKQKAAADLLDDIKVLENYLELGKYQGWLDSVNFLIIKKEHRLIEARVQKEFPVVPIPPASPFVVQHAEISGLQIRHRDTRPKPAPLIIKAAGPPLTDRQKKIVSILARRQKAQVQDFIKEMPAVTKRTIRRDLDDLLKKGKVARIGEFNQVFYRKVDRTHLVS